MGGMMPHQQQMAFGGNMAGPYPPFAGPGAQPMTSPASSAKESLQKKADQAFADLAVFK